MEYSWKGGKIEEEQDEENVNKRVKWGFKEIEKFKEKLIKNWTERKEKIKKAITWKKKEENKEYRKEEWFHKECRERKRDLMKILWEAKTGKKDNEMVKKRKEYKDTIRKKKEEHNEKWLKEIEKDKSMKKFGNEYKEAKRKKNINIKKR